MENSQSPTNFYLPGIEHLSSFKPLQAPSEIPNLKKNINRSLSSELKTTFFNLNTSVGSPGLAKQRLLNEIKSSEVNLNCKDHPDEEFQYYSFTNNKGLCSECLLSGVYTGCEVVGLKKAAERIRTKFDGLILEVTDKAGYLGLLIEQLVTKKRELNDFGVDYKNEVKEQFEKLRAAIANKEEEILESIEKVKREKQENVETKYETAKKGYQEVLNIRNVLSSKLESFTEIDLCQYYASKASLIQKFVEDESSLANKEVKLVSQTENLKEEFNLTAYHQEINDIIEEVNKLTGLEKNVETFEPAHSEKELYTSMIEHKEEISEINPFQSILPKNLFQRDEESIFDSESCLTVSRKNLNFKESKREKKDTIRAHSSIPFDALKEELEPISPLTKTKDVGSPVSPTEEKIKRLFEKVGSIGKIAPKQKEPVREQKVDLKDSSASFLSYLDTQKVKEIPKKSWDIYSDVVEDQVLRKTETTYSTIKLIDLDNTKSVIPKSFIPNFCSTKTPAGTEAKSSKKELLSSNWATGLSSTKNLKTTPQEDTVKQTTSTWNALLKSRPRNEEPLIVSKSFGSSNLTSNLRKLKRQMGLGGEFI